ncbi:MAG: methyltransferase domain-containing protein, partial [Chlamydiia bacterium]|nr:methyltransferase domain-containing protein [Chlamydiia bacterium]
MMHVSSYQAVLEKLADRIGLNTGSMSEKVLSHAIHKSLLLWGGAASDYVEALDRSPSLWQGLIREVAVAQTWFMRHSKSFDYLRTFVQGRPARMLSCGCATGEEAYSMAMVAISVGLLPGQFTVVGVDIHSEHIAHAARGIYQECSFREPTYVPESRFFSYREGCWSVSDALRSSVIFKQGNVCSARFWSQQPRFDVIFCRNLLIYLHEDARAQLFRNLGAHLEPN